MAPESDQCLVPYSIKNYYRNMVAYDDICLEINNLSHMFILIESAKMISPYPSYVMTPEPLLFNNDQCLAHQLLAALAEYVREHSCLHSNRIAYIMK